MNRDFKGIWIPREIWLNKKLSIQAKALWAEIWSLHDRELEGCYASNEYLCEFMDVKLSRLKEIMKELRDIGFLVDVSFDGRHRIIRAQMPEVDYGGQQPAGIPASCQPENRPADSRNPGHPSIYRDKSLDKSIDNTHIPAVAGGVGKLSPRRKGTNPKAKGTNPRAKGTNLRSLGTNPRARMEKVTLVSKELFPDFVKVIQKFKPNYVVKNELNMLESLDEMLLEGRTKKEILEVLEWAVNDNVVRGDWNGWSSKVLCKNPAAYLSNKFDQIETASKAKKERKFAPCSDDKQAYEALKNMTTFTTPDDFVFDPEFGKC